jgi:hypothetical protein
MPRMGFEGKIFYGVAGAEATTEITNSRDITYTIDTEEGDTTVRGDGSAPPIDTGRVTIRKVSALTWQMTNTTGDTTLLALWTAATAGTPVAIRTKDKTAGKGFDGDVYLSISHTKPLRGEQQLEFSVKKVTRENRAPQLYV